MQLKLRWGLLRDGRIAGEFADGIIDSETGILLTVANRAQESTVRFEDRYRISRRYVGYIANIHPMHAEWAIKAAESGKHILVEKPTGINALCQLCPSQVGHAAFRLTRLTGIHHRS